VIPSLKLYIQFVDSLSLSSMEVWLQYECQIKGLAEGLGVV
jgi:hypothetical protein